MGGTLHAAINIIDHYVLINQLNRCMIAVKWLTWSQWVTVCPHWLRWYRGAPGVSTQSCSLLLCFSFCFLITLHNCLANIKDWVSLNFLHLNSNKTELLLVGPEDITNVFLSVYGPTCPLIEIWTSCQQNGSISFVSFSFLLFPSFPSPQSSSPGTTKCSR